jgi:hypothetical protein
MWEERDRWRWEGPVPSLFDRTDYGLSAGVTWTIRAVRVMSVANLILMLYAIATFSRTETLGRLILVVAIAIGLIIPIIASHWIAISRPPSPAQDRVINQIASVSETQRRRIQALYDQDMLTFAEARRICDAGIYWTFDHRQGVWGVPASFIPELPPRLEALDRMVKVA